MSQKASSSSSSSEKEKERGRLAAEGKRRSLSFSGCGFLGIYHVGVAAALRTYGRGFDAVAGASAGAVAAACFLSEVCLGQGTSDVLRMVVQARSTALGPLHPSFRVLRILRDGLRNILPSDAHERCSGRLFVSLTRWSDGRNVLVSNFSTREDLIQALLCSCFIPFYCGTLPPLYKGERYIDGGWSGNLPVLGEGTVTVSPFSGESDICPVDADSASFLDWNFSGTSLRLTARNLYRLSVALFPPHPEILSQMCRQGFEDGLRWLTSRGELSCTRCLEIRSSITLPRRDKEAVEAVEGGEVGVCGSSSHLSSQPNLPSQVRLNLARAESEAKEGWLNWLFSFRPVRWARYALIPWTLPVDLSQQVLIRLLEWLPQLPSDLAWLVTKLNSVARFLLSEMESSGSSGRFTCQLAITELSISAPGREEEEERTEEYGFSVGLQPGRQGPIRQLKSLLKEEEARKDLLSNPSLIQAAEELEVAGVRAWSREEPSDTDLDSVSAILHYSRRHDALMAYYYESDDRNLNVFEFFGVSEGDSPRSRPVSRRPSFKERIEPDSTEDWSGEEEESFFVPRPSAALSNAAHADSYDAAESSNNAP